MTTHKHNLNEIYVIHEICFKNIVNKNRYLNGIRVYFFRLNFSEYKTGKYRRKYTTSLNQFLIMFCII